MKPFIQIENLFKSYSQNTFSEVEVIKGLNLKINSGDFLSLMGPSGSGKSTLLNLIGLLDQPNKGEIFFDGMNLTNLEHNDKARLRNNEFGFVFLYICYILVL